VSGILGFWRIELLSGLRFASFRLKASSNHKITVHSLLNDFTGFSRAARMDLYPTVIKAIKTDMIQAPAMVSHPISILYAKD
jgi:hypothetical protein